MSRRTRLSSVSNITSAKAFTNSVFPTPVGPTKRNEGGFFLGAKPARVRLTARDNAFTACSCPTTRWCNLSSRFKSRPDSDCVSFCTGMPVHISTTPAISCSVISTGTHSASTVFISDSRRMSSERISACCSYSGIASSFDERSEISFSFSSRISKSSSCLSCKRFNSVRQAESRFCLEPASSIKSMALSGW